MKLQQKNQKEKDFIKITFQGGIYESRYLFKYSSNKYIF